MTNNRLSVHQVLNQLNIITEYLEDMGVFFLSDLEADNFAEMQLISDLTSIELMEVLSYIFKVGE